MAKVAAESLPWLSKPSTGYDLFTKPSSFRPPPSEDLLGVSPQRRIATRESEVYFAIGNEVRCADLQDLKARHPLIDVVAEGAKRVGHREHKVLHLPQIDFEIKQLEISGDFLYLAVVGEKELAVAVLPGEGYLKREAARPTVPHFHRVGKGFHNADDGARITRVLWHPLGVEGAELVVLTEDGYVRAYDFTIGSELSFEVPDQTLDLYMLDGKKRHSGGFTADRDELAPASMCFGSGEQGWRPFTLYIAMRTGDVYAICPFVPSRWMAPREHLQRLSLDITAELESFDEQTTPEHRAAIRYQTKWINDVLNQATALANGRLSFDSPRGNIPTCLKRPEVAGSAPALQGPFLFEPAPLELPTDDCFAACDIFHVEQDPLGIIGILYSHGKVDISLELEPLTARWMDKKRKYKSKATDGHPELPVVSSYETIDLGIQAGCDSEYTSWPTFTKDPLANSLWFVNHIAGITAFSMKAWLAKLEAVLDDAEEDEFLARTLEKSPRSAVQKIVNTPGRPISGCTVVYEPYIGYLLVAEYPGGLESAEIDVPSDLVLSDDDSDTITLQPPIRRSADTAFIPRPSFRFQTPKSPQPKKPVPPAPLAVSILQPPYQIPSELTSCSSFPSILREAKTRNYTAMSQSIMFSSATFDTLSRARDTLKVEFDALMEVAQETHDRAASQKLEYRKQLEMLHQINMRLGEVKSKSTRERLERFLERQEELQKRADGMLRRLVTESQMGYSDAEKKWFKEVEKLMERVVGDGKNAFGVRVLGVTKLVKDMEMAAEEAEGAKEMEKDIVPEEVREGKIRILKGLLEREDVLVAATRKRLEGLEIDAERL